MMDKSPWHQEIGMRLAAITSLGLLLALLIVVMAITTEGTSLATLAADLTDSDADLQISKAANPELAVAGMPLTYTLTYANDGTSSASDVVVVDTLPAMAQFVKAKPSPDITGTERLTWSIGVLPPNTQKTIQIIVTVAPGATESVVNRAEIRSSTTDPITEDNAVELTTTVSVIADLSISKEASSEIAIAGQYLIYTLTYTNSGPSDATDVVLTDTLPAGASIPEASVKHKEVDPPFVRWELGSVAANDQNEILLTVLLSSTLKQDLENKVEISSITSDPRADNNVFFLTTPRPRIYVPLLLEGYAAPTLSTSTKTAEPPAVNAGELLTYTLALQNGGTVTATNVSLSDPIPPGTEYQRIVDGSPCQYEAGEDGGRITWQEPEIPGGEVRTCTFVVRVLAETEGTITNTATGTASGVPAVPLQETTPVMVANGGFETGDPPMGWRVTGQTILLTPTAIMTDAFSTPDDGIYQLRLGDAGYCNTPDPNLVGDHHSVARQSIFVPDVPGTTPRLEFSYRILTYDHLWWANGRLGDAFEVYVGNELTDELALRDNYNNSPNPPPACEDLQDSGWRTPNDPWGGVVDHDVLDLTEWKGGKVEVRFDLTTRWDGYYNTWAYLDEVRVVLDPVATESAGGQAHPTPH